MKTTEKRFIWRCNFDNWTWDDGYRCEVRSEIPMTKEDAEKTASAHCEKANREEPCPNKKHYYTITELTPQQITQIKRGAARKKNSITKERKKLYEELRKEFSWPVQRTCLYCPLEWKI